jgi:hypothetical protein
LPHVDVGMWIQHVTVAGIFRRRFASMLPAAAL